MRHLPEPHGFVMLDTPALGPIAPIDLSTYDAALHAYGRPNMREGDVILAEMFDNASDNRLYLEESEANIIERIHRAHKLDYPPFPKPEGELPKRRKIRSKYLRKHGKRKKSR